MLGKIEFDGQPVEFEDPNIRNLIAEVSTKVCLMRLIVLGFENRNSLFITSRIFCSGIINTMREDYFNSKLKRHSRNTTDLIVLSHCNYWKCS